MHICHISQQCVLLLVTWLQAQSAVLSSRSDYCQAYCCLQQHIKMFEKQCMQKLVHNHNPSIVTCDNWGGCNPFGARFLVDSRSIQLSHRERAHHAAFLLSLKGPCLYISIAVVHVAVQQITIKCISVLHPICNMYLYEQQGALMAEQSSPVHTYSCAKEPMCIMLFIHSTALLPSPQPRLMAGPN